MPIARVEVRRHLPDTTRQQFLAALAAAIDSALGQSRGATKIRYFELSPECQFGPADASEMFTVIELDLFPGRDAGIKRALLESIIASLAPFGIGPADIYLLMRENPPENWGIAGRLAIDARVGQGAENTNQDLSRSSSMPPFHLAIPVSNLAEARHFYGTVLGCPEGRSSETWVDFDFHGHQLVIHQVPPSRMSADAHHNAVDGDAVPVPHFGVVLSMPQWQALADQLAASGLQFVIEPRIRFAGEPGEQGTMFFRDPSGNALEIKGFTNVGQQLFAH